MLLVQFLLISGAGVVGADFIDKCGLRGDRSHCKTVQICLGGL